MSDTAHRFDEGRAKRYRPRDDFAKTAVLLSTADPLAQTVIDTRFGRQRFIGSFYVVAADDASYGAARREFEATHRAVGPNRWVKRSPVLAYRTSRREFDAPHRSAAASSGTSRMVISTGASSLTRRTTSSMIGR